MRPDQVDHPDGPWCTECGHPATATQETLDSTRPIGICRRFVTEKAVHCGRVIVTYHRDEMEAVYRARRWKVTTAHHHQHDADRDPVPFCHKCQDIQDVLDVIHLGTDTGPTQGPGATARKGTHA